MNRKLNPESIFENQLASSRRLLDRVRSLLKPPVFEDPEQSRKAVLLNSILLVGISLGSIYTLLIIFFQANPGPMVFFMGVVLAFLAVVMTASRSGSIQGPSIILIVVLWILLAVASFFFGGVTGSIYPTFVVLVFVAGLILNTRAAVLTAGLSIFFGIFLLIFSTIGLLPEPSLPPSPDTFFARIAINLLAMTFFLAIANRSTQNAMEEIKSNQFMLRESNQELDKIKAHLEETIGVRTEELERRNVYMETNTLIAQIAVSSLDTKTFLDKAAALVSEKLDFYHVGIFLIDPANEWAILQAASSSGGKQMISRGHRLRVGRQGIVGYVTGIGKPRISQNIGLDRIYSTTVELPDTRSEMALPLKARGQIIGAIDIQSKHQDAFAESDIQILQTIADQMALSIANTQLYEQVQQSVDEIQRLHGEYSHQAWRESYQRSELPSYRYSVSEQKDPSPVDIEESLTQNVPGLFKMPITVRGQTIGTIDIVKDGTEDWSDEEAQMLQVLSDQLGVALDGARLFSETQLRAATEQLIGQVSAEIRETLDIDTVLRTAASKVREVMNLPGVTIRLVDPKQPRTTNGQSDGELAPA